MEHGYDVLIIGGGVVGCAIARELAAYRLKIGVLEKNPDVGYETSARNTGVVHGGFAYDVGSLKAALSFSFQTVRKNTGRQHRGRVCAAP